MKQKAFPMTSANISALILPPITSCLHQSTDKELQKETLMEGRS